MKRKVRVLIVDDSTFARTSISRTLASDPEIEIIDTAKDGAEAVEKTKALSPDVVTLDVVMPNMDGLTALGRIMTECPTPVVMVSALTGPETHSTIAALEAGAVDFFLKVPRVVNPIGTDQEIDSLQYKVKTAAQVQVSKLKRLAASSTTQHHVDGYSSKKNSLHPSNVVVIGTSTGGPRALHYLVPTLPADLNAAFLIVQHMPAGFTRSLAERLDATSKLRVKEAQAGDALVSGQALIAPGGYHMTVDKRGEIRLNQDPVVCGVRPAVDVTMKSVAKVYGPASKGVVLTGMGSDGTEGAAAIKSAGGSVVVEDESTCAVYGMPKSVIDSGHADKVAPLEGITEEVVRFCRNP